MTKQFCLLPMQPRSGYPIAYFPAEAFCTQPQMANSVDCPQVSLIGCSCPLLCLLPLRN